MIVSRRPIHPLNTINHRIEVRSLVHLGKAIPRQPRGKTFVALEKAEAGDGFVWRSPLEEERVTTLDSAERSSAVRLPEVHLIYAGKAAKERVPIRIG